MEKESYFHVVRVILEMTNVLFRGLKELNFHHVCAWQLQRTKRKTSVSVKHWESVCYKTASEMVSFTLRCRE